MICSVESKAPRDSAALRLTGPILMLTGISIWAPRRGQYIPNRLSSILGAVFAFAELWTVQVIS